MPRLPKNQKSPYPRSVTRKIKIPDAPPVRYGGPLIEISDEEIQNNKALRDKHRRDAAISASSQAIEKMMLMLDHYKINRDNEDRWFLLSFALCKNHIEGFSVDTISKKGRKEEWSDLKYLKLYRDVEKKIISSKEKKSISWACEQLVRTSSWKGNVSKNLKNKHTEAKRSVLVRFYENMKKEPKLGELPGEFIDEITSYKQDL